MSELDVGSRLINGICSDCGEYRKVGVTRNSYTLKLTALCSRCFIYRRIKERQDDSPNSERGRR